MITKNLKSRAFALIVCPLIIFGYLHTIHAQEDGEVRIWTSKAGTTISATMLAADNESVKLMRDNGDTIDVPINSLSLFDQKYVKKTLSEIDPFGVNLENKEKDPAPELKVVAPELPDDFPKDVVSDTIPWLKRLKEKPLEYRFDDFISGEKITQENLKGKYVYVYTGTVSPTIGRSFTELKLLHAKYSSKGFTIISILSQPYSSRYSDNENFKSDRKIEEFIGKNVKDYGVDWVVSYSDKRPNPLAKKFSRNTSLKWLIGPDGKLIHSNISNSRYRTTDENTLPLTEALEKIFGK